MNQLISVLQNIKAMYEPLAPEVRIQIREDQNILCSDFIHALQEISSGHILIAVSSFSPEFLISSLESWNILFSIPLMTIPAISDQNDHPIEDYIAHHLYTRFVLPIAP